MRTPFIACVLVVLVLVPGVRAQAPLLADYSWYSVAMLDSADPLLAAITPPPTVFPWVRVSSAPAAGALLPLGKEFFVDPSGNHGIGTMGPEADLQIVGNLSRMLTGVVTIGAGTNTVTGAGTNFQQELRAYDALGIGGETFTVTAILDPVTLMVTPAAQAGVTGVPAFSDSDLLRLGSGDAGGVRSPRLVVNRSGRLGLGYDFTGTVTPQAWLHARGRLGDGELLRIENNLSDPPVVIDDRARMAVGNNFPATNARFQVGGHVLVDTVGNTGLGTLSPSARLHAYDAPTNGIDTLLVQSGTSSLMRFDDAGDLEIDNAANTAHVRITGHGSTGNIAVLVLQQGSRRRGEFAFDSGNDRVEIRVGDAGGGISDRIRMSVGSANIRGDGDFLNNGFGPSEWVLGRANPGEVVVMTGARIDVDGRKRVVVEPCREAHSRAVIGVVIPAEDTATYGNPDFAWEDRVGRNAERTWRESHVGIELTGFREVLVAGPVRVGDLLVTSEVPGHAMASVDPDAGTVIGKAAEDFDGVRGRILARIDLQ